MKGVSAGLERGYSEMKYEGLTQILSLVGIHAHICVSSVCNLIPKYVPSQALVSRSAHTSEHCLHRLLEPSVYVCVVL